MTRSQSYNGDRGAPSLAIEELNAIMKLVEIQGRIFKDELDVLKCELDKGEDSSTSDCWASYKPAFERAVARHDNTANASSEDNLVGSIQPPPYTRKNDPVFAAFLQDNWALRLHLIDILSRYQRDFHHFKQEAVDELRRAEQKQGQEVAAAQRKRQSEEAAQRSKEQCEDRVIKYLSNALGRLTL